MKLSYRRNQNIQGMEGTEQKKRRIQRLVRQIKTLPIIVHLLTLERPSFCHQIRCPALPVW